jgi:uncharacterized membrane protein
MRAQDSARRVAWGRWAAWLGAGLALAGLVAVAGALPPDGRERARAAQFVGRFHPLAVHLPIGLLVLVPILEIAGRRAGRAALREAAGLVLALAAAGALAAAWDGWLLGWSGGYAGAEVIRHMWGGAAVAGLGLAALGSRTGAPHSRVAAFAYPPLLALAFAAMVWTGHEGGSLSHGARFLTEEMPDPLRRWLGVAVNRPAPAGAATPLDTHAAALGAGRIAARVAAPPSGGGWNDPRAYAARIAPLFERSCVPCHRPGKRKGGLRMDTYAQLVAGGEDGPVIVPGDPRGSELVRRITLPADDDDYMPSDGRKPLSAEEVAAVEQWIAAGAKGP